MTAERAAAKSKTRRSAMPGTAEASQSELSKYSTAATVSSGRVIRSYSTSFGLANRMLPRGTRSHVANIYGLARIADEIVDGAAEEAGIDLPGRRALLDALEADTLRAIESGYSANLVVHAYATTARAMGIGADLVAPFFASMRRDLDPTPLTQGEVDSYIYGSAEVIGVMCLRAFLVNERCDDATRERLEVGARRLGAAFQKINFLRDLATDWRQLGRNYFPGVDPDAPTEEQKLAIVADIDRDLTVSARAIAELPRNCRTAIAAAQGLFSELNDRIRETPASQLLETRIRVPAPIKLRILAGAALTRRARSPR